MLLEIGINALAHRLQRVSSLYSSVADYHHTPQTSDISRPKPYLSHSSKSSTPKMPSLHIKIHPPSETRPRAVLHPPLAAELSSEDDVYAELKNFYVQITLLDENGNPVQAQPSGKQSDAAHPLPNSYTANTNGASRPQAYFYFPTLNIPTPGRFIIRATLMKLGYSQGNGESVSVDYKDTGVVVVAENVTNNSQMSKSSAL